MEGTDIPTVHISLPEKLYAELKRVARDMGIQITDLIKLFIKTGLDGGLYGQEGAYSRLSPELERDVTYLKGRVFVIDRILREVLNKIDELERRIEEIESPDLLLNVRKRGEGRLNKP